MTTTAALALRDAFRKLSSEPLSFGETVVVAAILFVGGTIYCQLYCLIAFQQMHGMAMPIALSMQRSAADSIPAIAAFELSKRALGEPSPIRKFVRVAITLALVAALTIAALLVLGPLCYGGPMPVRLIVADRLPGLTLTAIAIVWADYQSRIASVPPSGADDGASAIMQPCDRIDWVKAAGNYVEVHFGGKTSILRMTLGQALGSLGADRFVQIHRSVLVNRDRILRFDRRHSSQIQLHDGTLLKVGDAFRAKLFDE